MTDREIQYKLNAATAKDVAAHLEICSNNFVPPLNNTVIIEAYAEKIAKKSITFEAWNGQELVGMVAAYINDAANCTAYITNVSTVNSFSGQGIGKNLLKMCADYALEKGFREIILEVNSQNHTAVKLYEKNNYRLINTKEKMAIMKKLLP